MAKRKPSERKLREKAMVNDNLRLLVENSNTRNFQTTKRIFRYGASSFGRNVWLSVAATLVMTVTLIILFTTVVASGILSATAQSLHDKIDIVVYFKPETSQETLDQLKSTISKDSNVKEVTTSTKEQEFDKFKEEHADDADLMSSFDDKMADLVLNNMQATLHIKVNDPNNLDSIKNTINTDATFLENKDTNKPPSYDTDSSQIETINHWATIAQNSGIILSIIFIVISILVIFNTIRMAIFSRREEIYMMKLVGADNHFIRGPFRVEAQICGALSGVIASTIGFVGFNLLAPKLANYGIAVKDITKVFSSPLVLLFYLAMILIGILIGTISAHFAIRKYLH